MKRVFDFCVSLVALLLLAPVMLAISFGIWLTMGRPILHRHWRPGLHGRLFELLKFRTMRFAFDEQGLPLSDRERTTRFGNWLRKTSLDELPELINVLRGEMSLVGPRPLLVSYLEHYTDEEARRHDALPGLTGWAQVNGRNAIDWDSKMALDLWYVDHASFWLDLKILWLTVATVLGRRGATSDTPCMPPGMSVSEIRAEFAAEKVST